MQEEAMGMEMLTLYLFLSGYPLQPPAKPQGELNGRRTPL